jgi:hypothetical protein
LTNLPSIDAANKRGFYLTLGLGSKPTSKRRLLASKAKHAVGELWPDSLNLGFLGVEEWVFLIVLDVGMSPRQRN